MISDFKTSPRAYAMELVENEIVSSNHLLLCTLNFMSHDDVRELLDNNNLSPRFFEQEREEEEG